MIPVIVPVSSTHTLWFEYLLQPSKFQEHLEKLNTNEVYPLSQDLIKMFMAQAFVKNAEGGLVMVKNDRSKRLCEMCGEVILTLELSLDYIEENFPIEYQGISIYSIPPNSKKSFQPLFLLHRWIIRTFSKSIDQKCIQILISNFEEFENQNVQNIYNNSLEYLINWLSKDGEEADKELLYIVNFEIAEYLFIKENIKDAFSHFSKAKEIKDIINNSMDIEENNHNNNNNNKRKKKKKDSKEEILNSYLLTSNSILKSLDGSNIQVEEKISQKDSDQKPVVNQQLIEKLRNHLQNRNEQTEKYFFEISNSEKMNNLNVKKKANYYSITKQWKLSRVLYENGKDIYNCFFIDLQSKKIVFEINEALKLLEMLGLPDIHIFEYFISIMLNKNQFQDLQRYCDIVERIRRERSQTNPEASLAVIGNLCEFGQGLSILCESLKKEDTQVDFQRISANSLLFLNRFRKQDGLMKVMWDVSSGILSYITNTTILDAICLSFAALLRLHTIQALEIQPIPINQQMIDPNYLLLSTSHYGATLVKLQVNFQTAWNSLDSRTSSQFTSEGISIVKKSFIQTTKKLCELQPSNSINFLQHADAFFEDGDYYKAFREYLLAGCVETAFFSNSSVQFSYDVNTLYRMIKCLVNLQVYCQAAVLSQLLPSKLAGEYNYTFNFLQISPQSLNTDYFQYFWEISILELLISVFTKRKEEKKLSILIELISKAEINQNNSPQVRKIVQGNIEVAFLKELAREFLIN